MLEKDFALGGLENFALEVPLTEEETAAPLSSLLAANPLLEVDSYNQITHNRGSTLSCSAGNGSWVSDWPAN